MPTTVTTRTITSTAHHVISFRGLAGAILICLGASAVFYVIGFTTPSWASLDGRSGLSSRHGLWESCTCRSSDLPKEWFAAVQAMITIGLIALLVALILACIYLCIHTFNKNTVILALVIVCFVAVLFMLIGFIIVGVKIDQNSNAYGHLSWSFILTVIASCFCLVAGILSIVQMRQSGVRV